MSECKPSTSDVSEEKDLTPASREALSFVIQKAAVLHKDYMKKRDHSRWVATATKLTSVICGALLTIAIGLKPFLPDGYLSNSLSVIALTISSGLTALATWEAFSDHRWKWIRYRASLSALYELQDDMEFRKSQESPITVSELDRFYWQLRQTIHETNEDWKNKRKSSITGVVAFSSGIRDPHK